MKYSMLLVGLIAALGLGACAGPPGATGPPGVMGPTGYQGPTGRTGQSGADTVIVPAVHSSTNDRWNETYYYYDRW